MPRHAPLRLDVVIFGGGATGLWLLDELVRTGRAVALLESRHLGEGRTIASQGIIHGRHPSGAARWVGAPGPTPLVWRRCLAGERAPDLTGIRRRAEFCHAWADHGISTSLGVRWLAWRRGAKLLTGPVRPEPLRRHAGPVVRIDEQVIEPEGLLTALADRHRDRVLQVDARHGVEIVPDEPGTVALVRLINPESGDALDLAPRHVVLAAGGGNPKLRRRAGLAGIRVRRHRAHVVLARGPLPALNGHALGRSRPLTITTTRDSTNRPVWQIGGRIARDGVVHAREVQIRRVQKAVERMLPGVDFSATQWSSYAREWIEPATGRPGAHTAWVRREGRTITTWTPTLSAVPTVAGRVLELLDPPAIDDAVLPDWPHPGVAIPPWEVERHWQASLSAP